MLTVVDIQNKEFKKNKLGGYNIEDVNAYMEEIIKTFEEMQNDNYALKDKVNVLNESVQYYRTMESTIQNVLVLADKTAQDTKAAAYEKAEQIQTEAEMRSEKITALAEERVSQIVDQGRQEAYDLAQRVEEAKRQYLAYKLQIKQLMQAQIDFLNEGDEKIANMQQDLANAFEKIQEDALPKAEKASLAADGTNKKMPEEENFFTKAYIPVDHEA